MTSHRSLLVIIILAVVVVWTAAAFKVGKQSGSPRDLSSVTKDAFTSHTPVKPDSTFLQNENKTPAVPQPVGVPGVTAVGYLVGNVKTGKVYLAKNSTRVMPVASMSKLVTAFVATDILTLTSTITVTDQALLAPPDGSNLMAGEQFTLKEILQPLLLSSSNVAAEAISSTTDQVKFLDQMRSYAWEVGMPHSFFADPSGVSPQNVASAQDLFGLAKYLMYYRPDILTMTRMAHVSIATTTEHGSHEIQSTHPFVDDPRFIGGKTGRTQEAGETMMTILNIADQPIAFIILGARYGARENDTRLLLDKVEGMEIGN